MSETSSKKPRSQFRVSCLTGTLVILLAIVFFVQFFLVRPSSPQPKRLACLANLKQLGVALLLYGEEHGGQYPTVEQWCDLLVTEFGEEESFKDTFHCPEAERGPCNYAMNPSADPHGDGDVVLLFESKPGWNQFGGADLLTTENHGGKGCNILFVDGHVEFVKTEKLAGLKWVDEKTLPREPDAEQQPVNDAELEE
jgi:prepilin-type processing-associated H-X9-DG protein